MRKDIEGIVTALAEPIAAQVGVELYDVEFVKEGGAHYLRVFITAENGVDIEQCEAVSRLLDPALDAADPIDEQYYLEVSSVGLDRVLKKEKDFRYFMGEMIEIKFYKPTDGKKEAVGRLIGYEDGVFTVEIDQSPKSYNVKETALVRPYIEF